MPGQENFYNLGLKGVNVDKSLIHQDDGELLDAQNGQVDSVGAMGGLRVRDGMTRLNSTPLAGSIKGIIGLPLPDLDTTHSATARHFYAPIDDNGGAATHNFRTSTDGAAWSTLDVGLAVKPAQRGQFVSSTLKAMSDLLVWGVLNQKYYYAGNDYTAGTTTPTIYVWDGQTNNLVTRVAKNAYSSAPGHILSIVPYDKNKLLVTTYDDNTGLGRGRMGILDVTTGRLTQLANQSDQQDGACVMPIVFQGKIWWLSYNNGGGSAVKTFWTKPGMGTWVQHSPSPNGATGSTALGYIRGAVVFLGDLYFGSMADAGASARIRKLAQSGTYTTQRTSSSTTQFNTEGPMIVSSDGLTMFVYEDLHDVTGAGTNTAAKQIILKTTDGASYTTEFDVGSRLNNAHWRSGTPYRDTNGDIYWPFCEDSGSTGKILKRTAAGVWSVADGNDNHLSDGNPLRGQLTAIRF